MSLIAEVLLFGLKIYFYIIIIQVIVSWLIAFDVINARNPRTIRFSSRTMPKMTMIGVMSIPPMGGMNLRRGL